jgi:hypothetical protein
MLVASGRMNPTWSRDTIKPVGSSNVSDVRNTDTSLLSVLLNTISVATVGSLMIPGNALFEVTGAHLSVQIAANNT